jgi:hypothetical protein
MSAPAVVIAASNLMASLRQRLADEGDLIAFPDTEPIQALQAILEHKPPLIVLERLFAATPRGAALINRVRNDPQLAHAEIRVLSHAGDYSRLISKGGAPASGGPPMPSAAPAPVAVAAEPAPPSVARVEPPVRPLDWHGTRRAPRVRLRAGVEIQLDGNPARVLDLSIVGAQVVSATILRPNQKVRVSMPSDDFVMRFRGSVAWARFELAERGTPPRYRAGVEFADADAAAIDRYCQKNKE